MTSKKTCCGDSTEDAPPDAGEAQLDLEGQSVARGEAHSPEANDVEPHERCLPPQAPA